MTLQAERRGVPGIKGAIYSADEWKNEPERIQALALGCDLIGKGNFDEWFQGSVALNENRSPCLYHVTPELGFNEFDISRMDLGIHAGTFEQAYGLGLRLIWFSEVTSLRLIKVALKLTSPWQCQDLGVWTPIRVYFELERTGVIDEAECQRMVTQVRARMDTTTYDEEKAICRSYLQEHGFDGIGYVNTAESPFVKHTSWIALRSDQVWGLD